MENITKYLDLALQIIGVVSIIANLTPTESDNKIVNFLDNVLNIFAANFNIKGIKNK
jgi:hypothetical protein